MKKNNNNLSRRELLKNAALVGSGATLMPFGFARANPRRKNSEAIDAENSKPGTLEWQLQYTGFEWPDSLRAYPLNRGLRSLAIEGYASKTSVYPGENIDFKVSTEPAAKFVIDIYRMGYYGGKGGRHMVKLGAFKGKPQPLPRMTIERLRECDWETATSFTVPTDWPSGIYLAKLSREEDFGKQSYITFVVKEKRTSDILCQVSDLTWQAYNKWPGNNSLYDDGSPSVWYVGPGVRVSFDRPYAKYCQILDAPLSVGSGEFLLWEHPMVFWLEKQGYDVTYCSNLDLHLDSEILDRSKVFISIGHDEYWSRKMFNEAIKARDNGMSFAFLCGNSVYTEIEFYASSVTGAPCRSFSRKKRFDDSHELMGVSSYGVGHGDWVVKNSKNWIYEGTGFGENDKIPGLIGWEYHGPPLGDH
ncbi:MAG: N,N-dimethylformamidase beta subunit family domain-containing protein, partial [Cyclobacteriaceae bacterium]